MPDHSTATRRLTKTTMVTMSHAIERAGLATAEDGPMLVFAMFQRRPYFDREAAVYRELAGRSAAAVVGVVGPWTGPHPPGVDIVPLDEQEALAREWSVVVLTPRFGAVLVARDLEQVDPDAPTLESGRLFDSWWRFRRDDALHEALRLRRLVGARLPEQTNRAIDGVLDRVREVPAAAGEARAEAAARLMVTAVADGHARIRALRSRPAPTGAPLTNGTTSRGPSPNATLSNSPASNSATSNSPASNGGSDGPGSDGVGSNGAGSNGGHPEVPGERFLREWTSGGGTTASGTLPVALIGLRVTQSEPVLQRTGRRSGGPEIIGVLQLLQDARQPVDRVVRLDVDEFLLVMPSRSYPDATAVAHHLCRAMADLGKRFPFVAVRAHCIVTVTRQRPLPTDELRAALAAAVEQDIAVATFTDEHPLHPPTPARPA